MAQMIIHQPIGSAIFQAIANRAWVIVKTNQKGKQYFLVSITTEDNKTIVKWTTNLCKAALSWSIEETELLIYNYCLQGIPQQIRISD